jgi:hypothetical protein
VLAAGADPNATLASSVVGQQGRTTLIAAAMLWEEQGAGAAAEVNQVASHGP